MQRLLLFSAVCTLLISGGLAVFVSGATTRDEVRQSALQRWDAQALTNYRIAVVANALGATCAQELEIRAGKVVNTIQDTCKHTWLGSLTVEQLFTWSGRVDAHVECLPSFLNCACSWGRDGTVDYHPQLGYPMRIDLHRTIRANVLSLSYWQRVIATHKLSTCTTIDRRIQVAVVSLTSLPNAPSQ